MARRRSAFGALAKATARKATVARKQVAHVNNEKNILAQCEHPFLVNLVGWYQDVHELYMLVRGPPAASSTHAGRSVRGLGTPRDVLGCRAKSLCSPVRPGPPARLLPGVRPWQVCAWPAALLPCPPLRV